MTIRLQGRRGWGVVATVDEPAILLAAFVAHHLSVGAREVHLFFDRPDPEAWALLGGIDGVFLANSGEGAGGAWARAQGLRPARHQMRQAYNANTVLLRAAQSPESIAFLAHIDADEFITACHGGQVDFDHDAGEARPDQVWIRLRVEERAHLLPYREEGLFGGMFRRPWVEFEAIGTQVYGPSATFLKFGMSAHASGKAVARVGAGQTLGVHRVVAGEGIVDGDWAEPNSNGRITSSQAIVRHFDGLTPLHFLLKLARRGVNLPAVGANYPPARLAQYRAAEARISDAGALWALWDEVQGVSVAARDILDELMGTCATPCDIEAVTRARFARVSLTPADFDAALLAREQASFAHLKSLGFDPQAFAAK